MTDKEKDIRHSHAPKFKNDIPMPPVKPAPGTNCNKELKIYVQRMKMDRNEEFYELSNIIDNCDSSYCDYVAEVLTEEGYRKADLVRKETAKEIVDLLIQYDDGDSNTQAIELVVERFGLQDYIKENFFVHSDDEEDYE